MTANRRDEERPVGRLYIGASGEKALADDTTSAAVAAVARPSRVRDRKVVAEEGQDGLAVTMVASIGSVVSRANVM